MKKTIVFAILLALAAAPLQAAEARKQEGDRFSFYGIEFGMSREEIRAMMTTNAEATEAIKPGHGMEYLTFAYDDRDRLLEIRASYLRPGKPLEEEGLKRALREKFLQSVGARYRNVGVNFDEYGNRAAFTVVFTSLDLREENIEAYKNEVLKRLE